MQRFSKHNKPFQANWLISMLASLLCLFNSPLLLAEHRFEPFTAVYTVSRNGSEIGVRTHKLTQQDNLYLYEARMHTTGLASLIKPGVITERSQWLLQNKQIVPINYEYRDSSDDDRFSQLIFDWQKHSVTNHVGNKPWKMTIPDGTQDKFGYMLALMHDLKHGEKNPQYKIADGGRLKTYQFKTLATEVITTAAGRFKTVKLQRIRVGKKNRITYIWCLPEKNFLPIKIERHKRDNIYTMELTKLE